MDRAAAERQLGEELVPVNASVARDLHPAVAAVVAERPDSFGSWTPAEMCLFWAGSVDVDDRRVEENDDRAQVLGVWSVLARPADSAAAAPRSEAVLLFASNGRASRLGRSVQLDLERAEAAAGKVPVEDAEGRWVAGTDDRYQIKLGRAMITWDGRPVGDSAVPEATAHEWHAPGLRLTRWAIRGSVEPERSHAVVGALRISGKGDLVRALQASPIRFVGPVHSGGTARLVFTR